jgi:hypothetical protein
MFKLNSNFCFRSWYGYKDLKLTFYKTNDFFSAIDDVSTISGECPHYGDCDFEANDYCLWDSIKEATSFEWIIHSSNTPFLSKYFNKNIMLKYLKQKHFKF